MGMQEQDVISIGSEFYTFNYVKSLNTLQKNYLYTCVSAVNASSTRDLLAPMSDTGLTGASCTGFAQAGDGFAIRFSMLCKLRLSKIISVTLF
jgi:hypothetical protein